MAQDKLISRVLVLGAVTLFVATAVLLLYASSQRYELSKVTAALGDDVIELNRIIDNLRTELEGPTGCKHEVGHDLSDVQLYLLLRLQLTM